MLPKLVLSPNSEKISLDLSDAFLKGMEWLMLAQAQECSWQLAKLGALHFHSLNIDAAKLVQVSIEILLLQRLQQGCVASTLFYFC